MLEEGTMNRQKEQKEKTTVKQKKLISMLPIPASTITLILTSSEEKD